jgi:hypothetical protein
MIELGRDPLDFGSQPVHAPVVAATVHDSGDMACGDIRVNC